MTLSTTRSLVSRTTRTARAMRRKAITRIEQRA